MDNTTTTTTTADTKFETFCPLFPGFYNTIFDIAGSTLEYELQDVEPPRYGLPDTTEAAEWVEDHLDDFLDFRPAYLAYAQAIAEAIPHIIPFVVDAEYQNMCSPREYNFYNDAIDCVLTVDLPALQSYLEENSENLDKYLHDKYTSYDGFMSFHPNDLDGWKEKTDNFSELDGHYLGAVLEFVADNEEITSDDLYHEVESEDFENAVRLDEDGLIAAWEKFQANKKSE